MQIVDTINADVTWETEGDNHCAAALPTSASRTRASCVLHAYGKQPSVLGDKPRTSLRSGF